MNYDYWKTAIPQWMGLIRKLLNSHRVRVLGTPNMFLVHMRDESTGNVRGYEFQRIGSSNPPSAIATSDRALDYYS